MTRRNFCRMRLATTRSIYSRFWKIFVHLGVAVVAADGADDDA